MPCLPFRWILFLASLKFGELFRTLEFSGERTRESGIRPHLFLRNSSSHHVAVETKSENLRIPVSHPFWQQGVVTILPMARIGWPFP